MLSFRLPNAHLIAVRVFVVVMLSLFLAHAAGAQDVGDKEKCVYGSNPCIILTSSLSINQPFYFEFKISQPSGSPAVTAFPVTEDYPAGFVPLDPSDPIRCVDGNGLPVQPTYLTTLPAPPPLNFTIDVPAGDTLLCKMAGRFDPRGSNAVNTVFETGNPGNGEPASISSTAHNGLDADLVITKTRIGSGTVDISTGQKLMKFQVEVTTDQPVLAGPWMEILDQMKHYPQSIEFSILPPTNVSCALVQGGTVTNPSVCALNGAATISTRMANWTQYARFKVAGPAFVFEPGDKIVLTYDVPIQKHPTKACIVASNTTGLYNAAGLNLSGSTGSIYDTNQSNNKTHGAPVPIDIETGITVIDPTCNDKPPPRPDPVPAKLTVSKVRTNGPTGASVWVGVQDYTITLSNPANSGQRYENINIRDYLNTNYGAPLFDYQVLGAQISICAPNRTCTVTYPNPLPGPVITLAGTNVSGYTASRYKIDALDEGETAIVTLKLKLSKPGCDYHPGSTKIVRNHAVASYTYFEKSDPSVKWTGNKGHYADLDISQGLKKCDFDVSKTALTSPADIEFNQPFRYSFTITNNLPSAQRIPTLLDRMNYNATNYATGLPVSYSYTCTGASTATSSGSGSLRNHNGELHRGLSLVELHGLTLPPAGSVTCTVDVTIGNPPPTDISCYSNGTPVVNNTVFISDMRVFQDWYSWPIGVQGKTWDTVAAELPKCYSIKINKFGTPGLVTPAGPPVTYRVEVQNTSNSGSQGDLILPPGELIIEDVLSSGSITAAQGPVKVTDPCTNAADCTWLTQPGTQGGGRLQIDKLDAQDTLILEYRIDPPFVSEQICNRVTGTFTVNGAPTTRWYDRQSILTDWKCVDVRQRLEISKEFSGQLPPDFDHSTATYTVDISCTAPSGASYQRTVTLDPGNGLRAVLNDIPIGSVCTVTEQPPTAPIPSNCRWLSPEYRSRGQQTQTPAVVDFKTDIQPGQVYIFNRLDCRPRELTVEKIVRRGGKFVSIPAGSSYDITVTCTHPMWPSPQVKTVNFTQSGIKLVAGLPLGALCTATEADPSPIAPNCRWDKAINPTPIVIGPDPAGNKIRVVNTYSCDAIQLDRSGQFKVKKIIHPDSAPVPADMTFPVNVSCLGTTLDPSTFSLQPGGQQTVTVPAVGSGPSSCTVSEAPPPPADPLCSWKVDYSTDNGGTWQGNPPAVQPAGPITLGGGTPLVTVRNKLVCATPAPRLTIRKSLGQAGCISDPGLPGWNPATSRLCEFEITISNTGTSPFSGTLNFQDTWAATNTYVKSVSPWAVWSCAPMSPGNPTGTVTCSAPGQSLAPGASLTASLWLYGEAATMPAQNCAKIPGLVPKDDEVGPLGSTRSTASTSTGFGKPVLLKEPVSCIPLPQGPKTPVIDVSKTCQVIDRSESKLHLVCDITVAQPVDITSGTLVLEDIWQGVPNAPFGSPGIVAISGTTPWVCMSPPFGPGNPAQCLAEVNDFISTNAPGLIRLEAVLDIADIDRLDELRNCAQLSHQAQSRSTGAGTALSKTDCADIAPLIPREEPERTEFDLNHETRGNCRDGAAGYECAFVTDLTNLSEQDYAGPLVVDEVLTSPVPIDFIGSDGAGWSCREGPARSLTCHKGQVTLAGAETERLVTRFRIPDADGDEIQSCARLGIGEDPAARKALIEVALGSLGFDPADENAKARLGDRLKLAPEGGDTDLLMALGVPLASESSPLCATAQLPKKTDEQPACDMITAAPRGESCACLYPEMTSRDARSCVCSKGFDFVSGVGCVEKQNDTLRCDLATTTPSGSGCTCRYRDMRPRSETSCACVKGTVFVEGKGCLEKQPRRPTVEKPAPDPVPPKENRCGAGAVLVEGICVRISK